MPRTEGILQKSPRGRKLLVALLVVVAVESFLLIFQFYSGIKRAKFASKREAIDSLATLSSAEDSCVDLICRRFISETV